MSSDWLDIYIYFNTYTDTLEIVAIGEHNGEALKAIKHIPYKEIKNAQPSFSNHGPVPDSPS